LAYPWQLAALALPLLALLAGASLALERRLTQLAIWAGLVTVAVLSSLPFLAPQFTQVTPDLAQATVFGDDELLLLRADVTPAAVDASQVLTVTLAWQGLQPLTFDHNVFIHAVDEADGTLAQWDGQPLDGAEPAPMTTWQPGQIIQGRYRLELTAEQAAATRRLRLGLYNWQTGQRLPAATPTR